MEHVPVRVSERQDRIGLSDDTDQSERINYSNGCIRVHAQLDQGHGASKGALMFCFLFLFIYFIFTSPLSVSVCKGGIQRVNSVLGLVLAAKCRMHMTLR